MATSTCSRGSVTIRCAGCFKAVLSVGRFVQHQCQPGALHVHVEGAVVVTSVPGGSMLPLIVCTASQRHTYVDPTMLHTRTHRLMTSSGLHSCRQTSCL